MTNNIPNNQPAELWDNLVTTALLGTERRPLTQAQSSETLGAALAQFDANDQEHTLLGVSALLSLYQQAGMIPTVAERPELNPSEPDERPVCSARAAQHLRMMLDGKYGGILGEWLEALAQAGYRIPETMLPSLLDSCRTNEELHPLLPVVIGKRGHWLAAQNPAWHYASIDVAASIALEVDNEQADAARAEQWETSTRAQRLALLRQLRQRNPDKAREILLTTWAKEKANDRVDFLETFSTGLSQADEPFLENALDDRSKEVRRVAINLLGRMPESRLVQRMIERVAPLFEYAPKQKASVLPPKPERKPKLTITPLETIDDAMKRDGITDHREKGKKAWRLQQMLAVIPPSYWSDRWGAPPEDLLVAAAESDWEAALINGWIRATDQYADPAWARAFLAQDQFSSKEQFQVGYLIEMLPPEQREAYLIPILKKSTNIQEELIRSSRHRWSPELTKVVLYRIRSAIKNTDTRSTWRLQSLIKDISVHIPPTMLHDVTNGWPTNAKVWHAVEAAVESCIATVQFRYDMLKEISQ
ncbi:MAG: DUF5691 domain-containing protein [Chloroflexota bacterium]